MRKIAIVGSTGLLGKPVTEAFIKAGFEVSVLVRNAEKARELFGSGLRIVAGDLRDPETLKDLLRDQNRLYLNLSVKQLSRINDFQPERDGLGTILEQAKASGIKRIGYLSSLVQFYQDSDWWVLNLKKDAVKRIKQSGLTYSIFYPSTFMESFDKGAYRQGNRINLAGKSRYKMYLIAGEDYARQVVKAFEIDHGNNDYVIQGPDGYTADHAAKLFVDNYKKAPMKVASLPLGMLKFLGLLSTKFNYAANIVDILNNYPETFEAETTWKELGKPEITFMDYIRKA